MSVVNYVPNNPTIGANVGTLVSGAGTAFRPLLNANIGTVEDKVQLTQAYLENFSGAAGFGGIAGGSVSAGVGLQAVIGSVTAIVGNIVGIDTASTVSLTANATNYLFLRQTGVFTANTTGAIPGTADGFGTALAWGNLVTNSSTVTAVVQPSRWFPTDFAIAGTVQAQYLSGAAVLNAPLGLKVGTITTNALSDQTPAAAVYSCPYIRVGGTAVGTVNLIMPLQEGAPYFVNNGGAASVTVKVSGKTGITIASGKRAVVVCGTADYERWTADA